MEKTFSCMCGHSVVKITEWGDNTVSIITYVHYKDSILNRFKQAWRLFWKGNYEIDDIIIPKTEFQELLDNFK